MLIDLLMVGGLIDWFDSGLFGIGCNFDYLCLCVELFDFDVLIVYFVVYGVCFGVLVECYGVGGYGLLIYLFDFEGNMVEFKGLLVVFG